MKYCWLDGQIRGKSVSEIFSGGKRRSIGRVDDVVAAAVEQRRFVSVNVEALIENDIVVRMRATDALNKLLRHIPKRVARDRDQSA